MIAVSRTPVPAPSSPGPYSLSRRDGELLRILASVMVVTAHCVHFWVKDFHASRELLSLGLIATILDQFTRFTVPVFFFLSGFGLASQFGDRPPRLAEYYRLRLAKILAPFLLWSFLTSFRHIDYIGELPWQTAPGAALSRILGFLFLDGFDYQYYFLIVIFQFYLLFPFLYRAARGKWVLLGSLLLQMAFMAPMEGYLELWGWKLPSLHSNLLPYYAFYCVGGIYAARHRALLARWLQGLSGPQALFLWVGSFALLLAEYGYNLRVGKSLDQADHFNRWAVLLYCVAGLLLFMKAKNRVHALFARSPGWNFVYAGVAPYTFFVYLAHTHVLRLVDFLFWEVTVGDFISRILWVVGGSYALAWATQWLLEEHPRLRFALGLPKAPLRPADFPGFAFLAARLARRRPGGIQSSLQPAPAAE